MKKFLSLLWIIPATIVIMAGTLLLIIAFHAVKLVLKVFLRRRKSYA